MSLKFVARKAAGAKAKSYKPRKSINLAAAKRTVVTQRLDVVDNFGEVADRKRLAGEQARKLGHDLDTWHQRQNDPAGRWNAYCVTCNKPVVVCTETPEGFEDIYGPALRDDCGGAYGQDSVADVAAVLAE